MGAAGEKSATPDAKGVLVELLDGLGAEPAPVWAAGQLVEALRRRDVRADVAVDAGTREGRELHVTVGLADPAGSPRWVGVPVPSGAESFSLSAGAWGKMAVVGADPIGVTYGLLEVADRVRYGEHALGPLTAETTECQSPAVPVRGVLRAFACEAQDKAWFYSREFWTEYLSELAAQRFNRFQLAFGMQYNYSHDVDIIDNYFCFAYPFLVKPDGWDVSVSGLSDEERERNLEALRFASAEAARRGIHFQLGLWNHATDPGRSPGLAYHVTGLTPEHHSNYCAAALTQLLELCPSIAGVTFRVHYEGGVPEVGQEAFWGTVMSGISSVRRPVEIDMHAKGVSDELVEIGLSAGSSLLLSAKYWAEHQGLPYHQSAIRTDEQARPEAGASLDAKTAYSRRFTRYGYGDFLREGRSYGLIFRVWPGTQRVLQWGDPILAAGYGRLSTFAGSLGVELCEPLTFAGRKASGRPGERDPHAGSDLALGLHDWKKYLYTYRLWGRLLFDPGADASGWRRYLDHEFGAASPNVERALAAASRVLPLITVVHGVGASNNGYWPEVYVNMPVSEGLPVGHYATDTAEPKTFGSVSPLDPGIFMSIDEHVEELLSGKRSGRYSPEDAAGWLGRLAQRAEEEMAVAVASAAPVTGASFRRVAVDVAAQVGIARFFAGKFRAGIAYSLFHRTKEVEFLKQAIRSYEEAREAFASVASATAGAYAHDLAFGNRVSEHGHWADRLPAIDEDLEALRSEERAAGATESQPGVELRLPPTGERPAFAHVPPPAFRPGGVVVVEGTVAGAFRGRVVLHYRHVNQAERYETVEMAAEGHRFTATIGDGYTRSPYAIMYFFSFHHESGDAWLSPGFDIGDEVDLAGQPYYVVRQIGAS